MNRNEFEKIQDELQKKIGMWKIVIGEESLADFVIGCFFDNTNNQWKVYINNEKGRHRIRLQTGVEGLAFDKLLSMINFEIENNTYIS